jgi:hypothetical protein
VPRNQHATISRVAGAGESQNAKRKMQNRKSILAILHFSFCVLHFAFCISRLRAKDIYPAPRFPSAPLG